MATVRAALSQLIAENPTKSVAAYLSDARAPTATRPKAKLLYHLSPPLVPAATALYKLAGRSDVYTDLPAKHWLLTYMDGDTVLLNAAGKTAKRYASLEWEIAGVEAKPAITIFQGKYVASEDGPIAGGGLAKVAKAVAARRPGAGAYVEGSKEAALERALRYYQLAAYGLIGRAKNAGMMIGHYVGAIMVNDKGGIVGWGINTNKGLKDFHHAEVNMMLAYFQSTSAAKLPASHLVFSSLTPCEQCGSLLSSALGETNTVFYGQMDTGKAGRKGASMSSSTDSVCKPVAVHPKGGARMPVSSKLTGCVPEGASIASALKKSAEADTLLKDAAGDFERRLDKRTDEANNERYAEKRKTEGGKLVEDVKVAVLEHIRTKLAGIAV